MNTQNTMKSRILSMLLALALCFSLFTISAPGALAADTQTASTEESAADTGAATAASPFEDVAADSFCYRAVCWAAKTQVAMGKTATTFEPRTVCTRADIVTFLWRTSGSPEPEIENPFTDLTEGSYYYKAAVWAASQGITTGATATTFNPNGVCTRAEVVTFLWRVYGMPVPTATDHFTDVEAGRYYSDAVQWAAEQGIAKGKTATTFEPDTAINRGEAVTFLFRANNFCKGTPWDDSQLFYNQPDTQPDADDDFYCYANYNFLVGAQDTAADYFTAGPGGITEKLQTCLEDESDQSELMDQFRILYEQAMDTDAQSEQGIKEVKHYLEMINACQTLDELSALLASDDFPFDPFITLSVGANGNGMNSNNTVKVDPNLLFGLTGGSQAYQMGEITEDVSKWPLVLRYALNQIVNDVACFAGNTDTLPNDVIQMVLFEYAYGQYANYASLYEEIEYGTAADTISQLSMEELEQLAGNFPIREILTKYGCENGGCYSIECSDWLKTFGALYTADNLQLLKNIAVAQVSKEAASVIWYPMTAAELQEHGVDPAAVIDALKGSNACAKISSAKMLGNEFGSYYLDHIATEEDQQRLNTMVENIRDAYAEMVESCDWLDDATREAILDKLDSMRMNILQPEGGYDDYSDLQLVPTDEGGTLFSNYLLLKDYNWQKETARIGKAADSNAAWYSMGACTINAFYDQYSNSINILPGTLDDASYTSEMTDVQMYAAIGTVVGHEISHAFDVGGSQFDAEGTPETFFTENDEAEYLEKVSALEDYFSTISVAPGLNVDGEFVSMEATADLCGLRSALSALEKLEAQVDYKAFFETYARLWASTQDAGTMQLYLQIDTHNQNYIRVNADCQMIDEFYETYDVDEGDGMYLDEDERLSFWW